MSARFDFEKKGISDEEQAKSLVKLLNHGRDDGELYKAVKELLGQFPSLRGVCEADFNSLTLVDGISEETAVALKLLRYFYVYGHSNFGKIESPERFLDYAGDRLALLEDEYLLVVTVNRENKILGEFKFTSGNASKVAVSVRSILEKACSKGARGVYAAHNHPSSLATPSAMDDLSTKQIVFACKGVGLELYDHCIVGKGGDFYSYALSGKLAKFKGGEF